MTQSVPQDMRMCEKKVIQDAGRSPQILETVHEFRKKK